jgi:hypothetical protein
MTYAPKAVRNAAELLLKAKNLGVKVVTAFSHFINYEWMFDTNFMN